MKPSLFLLFNHNITAPQKSDARKDLGVNRIIDLPPDLKTLWRQIPPDLPEIFSYLEPVMEWLGGHAKQNDFVLIQGDFGACFIMVNFAFKRDLVPVYSTTRRDAAEEYDEDGTIRMTHRFQHHIFRKYEV